MTTHHHEPVPTSYGYLAEFATAEELIEACRKTTAAGYTRVDAYSPFPVAEVPEALGYSRASMSAVMFIGGCVGAASGFLMQLWTNAYNYPINVAGRPLNSWPSFIPITFEMMVLTASISGVLGLLIACGLPQLYHPVFNVPRFVHASRDRFFLLIAANDPKFDEAATREFLTGLNPHEVSEVQP
jgi:hypothetical protein